ncbi:nitroreductase family protein [Nocardioides stalactiti]|uniref:nitroreductase family protein n=1 Tax=Nocardioides stalactiti TaxID=2755356 RepID=UPI0015FEDF80|nr:nitroreductase family protein [Nocardioides stalactiti]
MRTQPDPVLHAPMPGAEGLAEPLRSRWSPSIFDARHRLTAHEIALLLHAAQWAPSSGNLQPWRFIVCERGDAGHQALVPHLSRGNSGWVPRASLVLLAVTQVADEPERLEDVRPTDADVNLYGLGLAAAQVVLQAQAMDLPAHQFGGFDKVAVAEVLGIPDWWRLVAGIAVGQRGEPGEVAERDQEREQRVRSRKPVTEIAFSGRWGVPWGPLTTQM